MHISRREPSEWIVTSATGLIFVSITLNVVVGQTLGSFSMGPVLLALYVAFWSYVLGSAALMFVSIWMLVMRKPAGDLRFTKFRESNLRQSNPTTNHKPERS